MRPSSIRSAVTFASRLGQRSTAAYNTRSLVLKRPYPIRPVRQIQKVGGGMMDFGRVIEGFDFSSPNTIDENMKRCLAQDLKESCFLLIKRQPKQFGDGRTQCAIAEAHGKLLAGPKINHRAAPRNAVIRISNDEEDGNLVYQAACWHNDMLPSPEPVQYTSLFMVRNDAPLGARFGMTKLVPSDQFFKRQTEKTQKAWICRHWGLDVAAHATFGGKGTPANKTVPMVYTHPHRGDVSLNIETEEECNAVFDLLPGGGRVFRDKSEVIQELDDELEEACDDYGVAIEWEIGDFLIFDNMAVLHKAQIDAYQTKEQREAAGLPYYRRTLHRVTCLTDLVRHIQVVE